MKRAYAFLHDHHGKSSILLVFDVGKNDLVDVIRISLDDMITQSEFRRHRRALESWLAGDYSYCLTRLW